MRTFFLALICLFTAAATAEAQKPAPTPPPAQGSARESTPELRRKTFQKAWEIVRDRFYDPDFNGVDWNRVRERYSPLADAVKSDAELYQLLNRMLAELKVSHMGVITPEAIRGSNETPVTTGLGLRNVEGRVTILRVMPGSSAERAALRPGFVVTQIDGADVKDLDDAINRLGGAPATKVRITYLDGRDERRERVLERAPPDAGELDRTKFGGISFYALFDARRLEGGVGYIRFSEFIPALNKKIREAVASMNDAPGIVIDLRGNGGGDDEVAINLAGLLFDRQTRLMITRTRKGDSTYYRARPAKNPYRGTVVILVDQGSGSASEQLTAGLQEIGRAYVVGKTTGGDDMDADLVKLPTGAYLIYAAGQPLTPKGVVVEGRGVIPDLEVNLTRAGLLRGEDAQLDAALEYIRRKAAK
jgi:carboxyl-terminal processing protease